MKKVSIFTKDHETNFDPEKETLILRPRVMMTREALNGWYFEINEELKKGVVMIPNWMDIAIIPKDAEILVEKESNN